MLGAWNDYLVARLAEAEEVIPLTSCSRPTKETKNLRHRATEACYRDLIQSGRKRREDNGEGYKTLK